jgi:hypothetical protein
MRLTDFIQEYVVNQEGEFVGSKEVYDFYLKVSNLSSKIKSYKLFILEFSQVLGIPATRRRVGSERKSVFLGIMLAPGQSMEKVVESAPSIGELHLSLDKDVLFFHGFAPVSSQRLQVFLNKLNYGYAESCLLKDFFLYSVKFFYPSSYSTQLGNNLHFSLNKEIIFKKLFPAYCKKTKKWAGIYTEGVSPFENIRGISLPKRLIDLEVKEAPKRLIDLEVKEAPKRLIDLEVKEAPKRLIDLEVKEAPTIVSVESDVSDEEISTFSKEDNAKSLAFFYIQLKHPVLSARGQSRIKRRLAKQDLKNSIGDFPDVLAEYEGPLFRLFSNLLPFESNWVFAYYDTLQLFPEVEKKIFSLERFEVKFLYFYKMFIRVRESAIARIDVSEVKKSLEAYYQSKNLRVHIVEEVNFTGYLQYIISKQK